VSWQLKKLCTASLAKDAIQQILEDGHGQEHKGRTDTKFKLQRHVTHGNLPGGNHSVTPTSAWAFKQGQSQESNGGFDGRLGSTRCQQMKGILGLCNPQQHSLCHL
jgi:hypothetical protein